MRQLIYCLFLLLSSAAQAKTICLNMIVKNESLAIQRCLESAKPLIDYWVIVDTGSTDGTQKIIRETLAGIPGELYERPWVNFAYNRNEALELAKTKGDYLLTIDADEQLLFSSDYEKPLLDKDCYFITVREKSNDYQRIALIDTSLPWTWTGVLHETLMCKEATSFDLLKNVINLSNTADGFRSQDPNKYLKDAGILEDALMKEPDNSRYVFYLAQSYLNAQEYSLALKNYQKRTEMGGWDEEIFWSLYQIGLLQEVFENEPLTVIEGYSTAYRFRPQRAEPLYRLASYYTRRKEFLQGYTTARYALSLPMPQDHIFVEQWIYHYGLWLVFAQCACEVRQYEESRQACRQILAKEDIPPEVRELITKNLQLLTE